MVKLPTGIILNPEYENLQKRLDELSEQYAQALADYTHFTTVVRKNLDSAYLSTIGRKEHQLFSIRVQTLQLRRKMSLIQAAANRGERLAKDELEKTIQKEFEEYKKQLDAQQESIRQAQRHELSPRLSAKKSRQVSEIFHRLVKKLHPDLNPDLPPEAAELWQRIITAYSAGDWSELILLSDIVDEYFAGNPIKHSALGTLELLQARIQQLEDKISTLAQKKTELAEKPPFSYQKLLDNSSALLEKRSELDTQIKEAQEICDKLQQILDLLWQNQ